jgi:hypothetical protein
LWGVSLGASSALLAERRCPGSAAIISDSSFLSFSETIKHHFHLILPSSVVPIANTVIFITAWRMGFHVEDGDVERAVAGLGNVPILFIAGRCGCENRRRHSPNNWRREHSSPQKQLLVVPGPVMSRRFGA